MGKELCTVDVYTASIPQSIKMVEVLPRLRQEQIENTTHPGLKLQRYYVWKLLEYALHHSLGLEMNNLHFSRTETGKWICEECFFSLSHTQDAVAVAVSGKPVGVDLECTDRLIRPNLAEKILTPEEKLQLSQQDLDRNLLKMWCAKESLFKADSAPVFCPHKLPADRAKVQILHLGEKTYCLAVAADNLNSLTVHESILL